MSLQWTYGVTTIPDRVSTLLPQTLSSLERAGFPSPRIFLDGGYEYQLEGYEKYEATCRMPKVHVAANWMLSLLELYLRNSKADRYAIFQDDLLVVKGLREYLDRSSPLDGGKAYLNLYTVLGNRSLALQHGKEGWFKANQLGKGALGLVFDNEGCRTLLSSKLMINRSYEDEFRGWRGVDGGISEALCRRAAHTEYECNLSPTGHTKACLAGNYTEWCHRPSLIQHVGTESSIDKREESRVSDTEYPVFKWLPNQGAEDFPEPDWNPLDLPGYVAGKAEPLNPNSPEVAVPKVESPPTPWALPKEVVAVAFTPETWEQERIALETAIKDDEARVKKEPHRQWHYYRIIEGYRRRLAEHLKLRPK